MTVREFNAWVKGVGAFKKNGPKEASADRNSVSVTEVGYLL